MLPTALVEGRAGLVLPLPIRESQVGFCSSQPPQGKAVAALTAHRDGAFQCLRAPSLVRVAQSQPAPRGAAGTLRHEAASEEAVQPGKAARQTEMTRPYQRVS